MLVRRLRWLFGRFGGSVGEAAAVLWRSRKTIGCDLVNQFVVGFIALLFLEVVRRACSSGLIGELGGGSGLQPTIQPAGLEPGGQHFWPTDRPSD